MRTHPDTAALPIRSSLFSRCLSGLRVVGLQLNRWYERHLQRCELGELDARLLSDIGVTRAAARRESNRAFWRGRT